MGTAAEGVPPWGSCGLGERAGNPRPRLQKVPRGHPWGLGYGCPRGHLVVPPTRVGNAQEERGSAPVARPGGRGLSPGTGD